MRCSHGETFPWREELQQSPEVGTEPSQMGEAGRGEVQVQVWNEGREGPVTGRGGWCVCFDSKGNRLQGTESGWLGARAEPREQVEDWMPGNRRWCPRESRSRHSSGKEGVVRLLETGLVELDSELGLGSKRNQGWPFYGVWWPS